MSTPIHDSLYYSPLNAYLGMTQTYFDTWCIVLWKNSDVISEYMGIYSPVLYIFKMLTVKNSKKATIRIFLSQFPYVIDVRYLPLTVCFERDEYW